MPKNLCARIPDTVPDDHAAFTVLAAIGLQGIRLVNPAVGECVAVTGLGADRTAHRAIAAGTGLPSAGN